MTPPDQIEIGKSAFSLISDAFEIGLPKNPYSTFLYEYENSFSAASLTENSLKEAVEGFEKNLLKEAFAKYKSTYKVAAALKTPQSTIARKKIYYDL